jgi:predicted dehydrogenase
MIVKKLRVAVIGAGAIAEMAHLPFYASHPEVELVALTDFNQDRAMKMANQFQVKNVYASAEEMLQNEKLDAFSICTRNDTHVALAKLALLHGAHVLVEKPLALNAEEAMELKELVLKTNKICMVGMTHRFRNDTRKLKQIVEAGDLGEIYYVKAKLFQKRNTPMGWFTDKSKSGGGPLMDIGVHVLDLAWWLSGTPEVESVSGHLVQGVGRYDTLVDGTWAASDSSQNRYLFDVEDFASAFLRFKNGLVMQLEVSWAINGEADEGIKIDLFGKKGGASLQPFRLFSEKHQVLTETKFTIPAINPYQEEIHHFIQAVQAQKQPIIDLHQGVQVMKMLETIAASSEKKRELMVEDYILAKK